MRACKPKNEEISMGAHCIINLCSILTCLSFSLIISGSRARIDMKMTDKKKSSGQYSILSRDRCCSNRYWRLGLAWVSRIRQFRIPWSDPRPSLQHRLWSLDQRYENGPLILATQRSSPSSRRTTWYRCRCWMFFLYDVL